MFIYFSQIHDILLSRKGRRPIYFRENIRSHMIPHLFLKSHDKLTVTFQICLYFIMYFNPTVNSEIRTVSVLER